MEPNFTGNVWNANGRAFRNPGVAILDSGLFEISDISLKVYDYGTLVKTYRINTLWIGSVAIHLSLPNGSYDIQLVNNSWETVKLTGGEVWYK